MSRRIKAFTLIELLVVISIIALLLAILMPALGMVKEKARLVVCSSNMHQVIIGVSIYSADNSNTYPPPSTQNARANVLYRRKGAGDVAQYDYLGLYIKDVQVFNCPSTGFKRTDEYTVGSTIYTYQDLYQRGYHELPGTSLPCSYLMFWNYNAYNKSSKRSENSNNKHGKPFIGPSKQSRNTLLISDSFFYTGNLQGVPHHWASNHKFKGGSKGVDWFQYYVMPGKNTDIQSDNTLNEITLNAGYVDGSVRRNKSKDTIRQQAVTGYAESYIPSVWK